jgi:hypothetical protein
VSSIEPDSSAGEIDAGEEISGGFVIAGGDGSELLEPAEEILDPMAHLVALPVERGRIEAVWSRWNYRRFAGGGEWLEDALVGIEGAIGDQEIGRHLRQEHVGADQIMRLAGGEEERERPAERIDEGMDFGAQPAAAAADGFVIFF